MVVFCREVLEDYEAPGLELDFMFDAFYFKAQEPRKAELMTAHVTAMRQHSLLILRDTRILPCRPRLWA